MYPCPGDGAKTGTGHASHRGLDEEVSTGETAGIPFGGTYMEIIAYLDPGTGSLIVQAVIGGAAGITMLVKTKGRRMLKKQQKADAQDTTGTATDQTAPAAPSD